MLKLVACVAVLVVVCSAGGGKSHNSHESRDASGELRLGSAGLKCLENMDCLGADINMTQTIPQGRRSTTYCCSGFATAPNITNVPFSSKINCMCPFGPEDTCNRGEQCSSCPAVGVTTIRYATSSFSLPRNITYCCQGCEASGVTITSTRLGDVCQCNAQSNQPQP